MIVLILDINTECVRMKIIGNFASPQDIQKENALIWTFKFIEAIIFLFVTKIIIKADNAVELNIIFIWKKEEK